MDILKEISERLPLIKDERLECITEVIKLDGDLHVSWVWRDRGYSLIIDKNLAIKSYRYEYGESIYLWDLVQDNSILYSLTYNKIKELPTQEQVILAYVVQIVKLLQESEGE